MTYTVAEYTLHTSYALAQALWNPIYQKDGKNRPLVNESSNALFFFSGIAFAFMSGSTAVHTLFNMRRFIPTAKFSQPHPFPYARYTAGSVKSGGSADHGVPQKAAQGSVGGTENRKNYRNNKIAWERRRSRFPRYGEQHAQEYFNGA